MSQSGMKKRDIVWIDFTDVDSEFEVISRVAYQLGLRKVGNIQADRCTHTSRKTYESWFLMMLLKPPNFLYLLFNDHTHICRFHLDRTLCLCSESTYALFKTDRLLFSIT